jgi:hypothetical protein
MDPSEAVEVAAVFLLTVAIEWPLFAWVSKLGFRKTGLFCLLMNGASWFTFAGFRYHTNIPVWGLEIGVMVVEAIIIAWFWNWRPLRAIGVSILLNVTSWGLGIALIALVAAVTDTPSPYRPSPRPYPPIPTPAPVLSASPLANPS